ncbi:hypothetical protein Q5762_10735 [Streptomyces sp. P9(2023)]|uniref:hypothetical protein n=1 Tax=Streptomyces sp. P9(2023) TaxID=3064394 RepID=UPI0028F3FAB8|nr:hypothetical protein [Streptomyces sp. P9(2023)]MDT9688827.1 hypothetical protein [Streptomyces sp. P9(2023)]
MRTAIRVRAGVGALLAAVVLALVPLPQDTPAAAATGDGSQDSSALTKRGTKGPHDDFSDLEVTVHQTKNLRAQGVKVSWKGGKPTQGLNNNYLQIMQCWGDDPAGPKREQCQFGVASTGGQPFGNQVFRRLIPVDSDPLETQYDELIDSPDFPGQKENPFVPFAPVSGPPTKSIVDFTYFGPGDTNEQFYANTQPDGTGQAVVSLQTTREAPHLGCGDPVTQAGKVRGRGCWLVVVPRGEHDPKGQTGVGYKPITSPLSTTNWNQRMVFPLDFLPVREPCPTDKPERRMSGSELITDAITSWQSALCAGGDTRFTFTQRGESQVRNGVVNGTPGAAGLAFTVQPVEGGAGGGFVHAPVAVSGLTVGFFWEADGIGQVPDLRVGPRLLAKMLTLSYPYDIRVLTDKAPVPDHVKDNPVSIVRDPEFLKLNPEFEKNKQAAANYPGGILLSAERSDVAEVVWEYLRSNAEARAFLEGKPDPWGMKVNPFFKDLGLATTGTDEFPKADPTETELVNGERKISYGVTERSPYALDMHDAAQWVRRGTNNAKDRDALDDTSTSGLKLVSGEVYPGGRRAYGITDAASASRYQIQTASLLNADGAYVRPGTASLLKAVEQFKDSGVPGVLDPDPARARDGAYPLTIVTYAVASTSLPADARKDYARVMRYAAGGGQRQGTAPGELPYGYAPMPAKLKTQADVAADALESGVLPGGPGGSSGDTSGSGGAGGSSSGGGSGGGDASADTSSGMSSGGTGAGGGSGDPSTAPSAAGGKASGGSGDNTPKEQLADAGTTPSQVLGVIRWVLLGVLVAGGVAGLAGPVMLRYSAWRAASG